MTTLHFNTDAGRNTAAMLNSTRGNIEGEIMRIRSTVNSLVGSDWQGASAMQFQDEMMTWINQINQVLGTLDVLKAKLETEIVDWEQTGSQLG